MIDELFPPLPIPQRPTPTSPSFPNFTFSERTLYIILWNGQQCVVWIEVVVFTHLTKVTWRSCHCRQTGGFTPLSPPPPTSPAHPLTTTSGLGTPLKMTKPFTKTIDQKFDLEFSDKYSRRFNEKQPLSTLTNWKKPAAIDLYMELNLWNAEGLQGQLSWLEKHHLGKIFF